jgi:hypothetical protein
LQALKNIVIAINEGQVGALKDLFFLLRAEKNKHLSQRMLENLILDNKITAEQKKYIITQKDLFNEGDFQKRKSFEAQTGQGAKNMIEHAKQGNMEALSDLIKILIPSSRTQDILWEIYKSVNATNEQREFISAQTKLFSKHELRKSLGIKLALDGDIEALANIIDILDVKKVQVDENSLPDGKSSVWVDQSISETLLEIFFSPQSTSEQKELIWLHKDMPTKIAFNKRSETHRIKEEYEDEDGYKRTYDTGKTAEVVYVDQTTISFAEHIRPLLQKIS